MRIFVLQTFVLSLALSGCSIAPKPVSLDEMSALAQTDREAMFAGVPPLTEALSLEEAIARALKFNLDRRVKLIEEALAFDQTRLDAYEMLPKAVANAGYLTRSNGGASTSTDYVTGLPSLANPSYSQDRARVVADLSFSWNVLDFGLSWYSARQSADRALIAQERRRKAALSIVGDVHSAYWRALGAQVLRGRMAETIREAEQTLEQSRRTGVEQLRSPLEALRFQKTILENLRQLRIVEQELASANTELAALINLPPGAPFRLAARASVADNLRLREFSAHLPTLEERAFSSNPELLESVYQGRIAVDDTRKAMLRILPGLNLALTPQYDGNRFLIEHQWQEASVRLAGNLVANVLTAPARIAQSEQNEKAADARRLALRMATLARIHIAVVQIKSAEELFKNARAIYEVDRKIATTNEVRQQNQAQSAAETIANKTVALVSEMRAYSTFAQLQTALGRLHASVGSDLASDQEIAELELAELRSIVKRRMDAINAAARPG